jgi:hypothetical protein
MLINTSPKGNCNNAVKQGTDWKNGAKKYTISIYERHKFTTFENRIHYNV